MASPIRRLVQLILDKKAAQDTEDGARKSLGGVDTAVSKVRAGVKALAASLAAAFAVNRIVAFTRAAVAEFAKGERAQAQLRAAFKSTGAAAWTSVEALNEHADALQEITTFSGDELADAQSRLLTYSDVTGKEFERATLLALDWSAALGVSAVSGAESLGKALNYPTVALGSLSEQGFIFTEAQREQIKHFEKTNQLAKAQAIIMDEIEASFGGTAVAIRNTFGGAVAVAHRNWEDMLESIGAAIVESEGAGTAMNFLTAAIRVASQWIAENGDRLRDWVSTGINVAITSTDVLLRALLGIADLLQGGFKTSVGIAAVGVSLLAKGYALAYEAAAKFLNLIGAKETAANLIGSAEVMRDGADAIKAWADGMVAAGGENVKRGLHQFTRPLFTAEQFKGSGFRTGDTAPGAVEGGAPGEGEDTGIPVDDEVERIEGQADRLNSVLATFGEGMAQHRTLVELLGSDFNALQSEASLLENAISQLAKDGFDASDPVMEMMRDRLREVRGEMGELEEATRMEEEAMHAQAGAATVLASAIGAAMSGGLGPFAKSKAKQNLLEAAELAIRATVAAITGFGAARAGVFASAAGKHLAIAAAWGTLGASMGGGAGGAGAGAAPVSTGGGGRSATPAVARQTTSNASRDARQIESDVAIYLTGPGFHALNPEVQRVVRGAVQEGTERFGNARVRVVRRSGP